MNCACGRHIIQKKGTKLRHYCSNRCRQKKYYELNTGRVKKLEMFLKWVLEERLQEYGVLLNGLPFRKYVTDYLKILDQIDENNLPENKERILEERNRIPKNSGEYPVTPDQAFKKPKKPEPVRKPGEPLLTFLIRKGEWNEIYG